MPAETKADEYRVALTPAGVRELVDRGHNVIVQAKAGVGSGLQDDDYSAQGARLVDDAESVFAAADLVVKVKEPDSNEARLLESRHVLFTYLHLAANGELVGLLKESRATCIAYETVEDGRGRLPLLAPMSEVAGKVAVQAGAFMLEKPLGGRGLLLGGVAGVPAGRVLVIGAGVAGAAAAQVAAGLGAGTYVCDRSMERLRHLDCVLHERCTTIFASSLAIEHLLPEVDLVIGAVLIRGALAPKVIGRHQLALMKRNAVLVDISIDQGGCFETSRPTTHSCPTFEVDGVTHYCVTNMPGAVPATSTFALANATLPYIAAIADKGVKRALGTDPGLLRGLNVSGGRLTSAAVAAAFGDEALPPGHALSET